MKRGPWVNMFLELHVACCLSLRGSSIAWSPLVTTQPRVILDMYRERVRLPALRAARWLSG